MKIELNSASTGELQTLKGIGPVLSAQIVAARPFTSVQDLLKVCGIGPKKLVAIESFVYICNDKRKQWSFEDEERDSRSNQILVDINAASFDQLKQLHGIGDVLAERIIESRPFSHHDELLAVKGIKERKFQGFQHQLLQIDPPIPQAHADFSSFSFQAAGESLMRQDLSSSASLRNHNETTECVRKLILQSNQQRNAHVLLATWNLRNLSKSKDMKHLERIAEIIKQFDLVALQEVRDQLVLKRLRVILPGWQFVASPAVGSEATASEQSKRKKIGGRLEYYAFFYRLEAVRVIGEPSLLEVPPATCLTRQPFLAHFACSKFGFSKQTTSIAAASDAFEFSLINVHLGFGLKQERLHEMKEMKELLACLDDKAKALTTPQRPVFLVGDFNLAPHDVGMMEGRFPLIRSPLATTIFDNLYDNIWLDLRDNQTFLRKFQLDYGVFRMDWKYYEEATPKHSHSFLGIPFSKAQAKAKERGRNINRMKCSKEISDHCPVWVAISPK